MSPDLQDASRFANRELSDLRFIERVLAEAHNHRHPLLERLRFLGISAAVLDQYFSLRVPRLEASADREDGYLTPDGLTPRQQLRLVHEHARGLAAAQQDGWRTLRCELEAHVLAVRPFAALTAEQQRWARNWFAEHLAPALSPTIVDVEHPFPFIASGALCGLLEFADRFVLVPLPRRVPRFLALPGNALCFVGIEEVLAAAVDTLMPAKGLRGTGVFQVLRDDDLARQDQEADLLARVESGLQRRHLARAMRLRVCEAVSQAGVHFLAEHLDVPVADDPVESRVERAALPGLARLPELLTDRVTGAHGDLLFPRHRPVYPPALDGADCFEALREGDVLAHWPYDAFDSVVDFLRRAAHDPDVLAIKQTLYRTSDDSPIVAALVEASRQGKAVTTVIELEARENESSNVRLARTLQSAGVHVVYGIVDLKIHCKATLVVRREGDTTRLYSHLSSGNYHPGNARIYTDLSYFSADSELGRDVAAVFTYITSGTLAPTRRLLVAPLGLRSALRDLVEAEIEAARAGRPARIVAKVNALTDPETIDLFYRASEAGVDVDLVVRRQCVLRPGVPGLSSRIRVKSIVGRFLEHSRIIAFSCGGPLDGPQAKLLIGSADLMERNLDDRVEVFLPVEDPALRAAVLAVLEENWRDARQSWWLGADGEWSRDADRDGFCVQSALAGQPVERPVEQAPEQPATAAG